MQQRLSHRAQLGSLAVLAERTALIRTAEGYAPCRNDSPPQREDLETRRGSWKWSAWRSPGQDSWRQMVRELQDEIRRSQSHYRSWPSTTEVSSGPTAHFSPKVPYGAYLDTHTGRDSLEGFCLDRGALARHEKPSRPLEVDSRADSGGQQWPPIG